VCIASFYFQVAYGQLQEKFSIEYRNLLESAINSASRIQTGYDSSVADRVSFSFSSRYGKVELAHSVSEESTVLLALISLNGNSVYI